jgi:glutathione S-transferase
MENKDKLIIGYWPFRGRIQAIRFLLEFMGVAYENQIHKDRDLWFKKESHDLNFSYPNLPYLIDGDFKLTETSAIVRYICGKFMPELLG